MRDPCPASSHVVVDGRLLQTVVEGRHLTRLQILTNSDGLNSYIIIIDDNWCTIGQHALTSFCWAATVECILDDSILCLTGQHDLSATIQLRT